MSEEHKYYRCIKDSDGYLGNYYGKVITTDCEIGRTMKNLTLLLWEPISKEEYEKAKLMDALQ